MPRFVSPYDEGLILVGASRILDGDVPYRDFWTMYGPGQFYVIAGLMSVFGKSVVVERLYECLIRTTIVYLAYLFLRRFAKPPAVLLAVLGLVVLIASTGSDGFPVNPALAFSLAAFLCVVRSGERPESVWEPTKAGICTGLAALFRHDLGFYALVACTLGLALDRVRDGQPPNRLIPAIVRSVGLAVTGCAVLFLPALAGLLAAVPIHDLVQNLIDIPLHVYPKTRALPFPRAFWRPGESWRDGLRHLREMSIYIPFLSCAAVGLRSAGRRAQGRADRKALVAAAMLFAATALFAIKGLVRVSPEHMLPSIVCAILLLTVATGVLSRAALLPRAAVFGACGLVAICLSTFGMLTVQDLTLNTLSETRLASCTVPQTPAVRCFAIDPDMLRVAEFIESHTTPDERIYVGPGRHDKIFFNDVTLYFAAMRLPGTKWHDSHPGVQTTRSIQAAMISDLEAKGVRLLVENSAYDAYDEPNESRSSSGVVLFDDYVARNFVPVFTAGSYTVFERRPS